MRIQGPNPRKYRYHSLPILFILACSIATLGKNPGGSPGSNNTSQLTIAGAGPSTGPTAGGTTVTIVGTGFTHSASVIFGGAAAPTVIYVSSTKLQALTPAHASGTVSVLVAENPHNQSATLAGGFTYAAANPNPIAVSAVSPSQGPTSGGTAVIVTGTGFQAGATVAFGNVQSTAITVASSTQISAVSPPESAGTVGVTVTGPDSQSASLPSAFTYTSGLSISSVSPQTGPATGGTTVTLLGSGFQSGASVAFGGITATSVNFVSSTEIQAVTPVSQAGTVSIAVANSTSQIGTLTSAFTFYHTVSVAWTGSTSTVSGYNIYRGSTSGGPYSKLNSALIPGTSFTDNSVQAGLTYFYVTTAVNSSNVESSYSNQAQAIVPSP